MIGKKIESADTPTDRDRPMGNDRQTAGGEDLSGQAPSRLSAAIMRILATARGATEGRRTITAADLAPPRRDSRGDEKSASDEDLLDGDAASRIEWSLRMMQ